MCRSWEYWERPVVRVKERPPDPTLRASDADRERVVDVLRRHTAEGRLTPEELEERLETVYAARTLGDLEAPVHDLPPEPAPRSPRRPVPRPGRILGVPLAVLLAVIVVAAVAAPGHAPFWLLWFVVPWMLCRRPRHRRAPTTWV